MDLANGISFKITIENETATEFPLEEYNEFIIESVTLLEEDAGLSKIGIKLLCTFDSFYYDSDDEDLTDPKMIRSKTEVAHILELNSPKSVEFIMNKEMHPSFNLSGTGKVEISGLYFLDDSAHESDESQYSDNENEATEDENKNSDDENEYTNDPNTEDSQNSNTEENVE